MSIQDERDLRTQLSGLLDGLSVRPAPVGATIRRGGRIRMRRRITVAAGLAAAVLAAVLPGVLTGRPHSAGPVAPQHHTVSVQALGAIARGGVIAAGVTDGKWWHVVASSSPAPLTIQAVGAIGAGTMATGTVTPIDPVDLLMLGDDRFNTFYGTVSHDVTKVVVQLPGGQRLTLTPVSWGGYRWVGLVLPAHLPTVRASAYSGTRELAYSVPFQGTEFVAWWAPGQVGPAQVTKSIGAVVNGRPWHATAWIGPWGWCYSLATGSRACSAVAPAAELRGKTVTVLSCSLPMGKAPTVGIAVAASAVRRVVLRYSNGSSASFSPTPVPGGRVFGYVVPSHVRVTSSREYGARGQLVGSQSGQAVGGQGTPGWSC